ncbi:MAG: hypothetical protein SVK08_01555 [Halobacteriota archaeon]|nr:hypothetical protein [Halobacteriota archaeon]
MRKKWINERKADFLEPMNQGAIYAIVGSDDYSVTVSQVRMARRWYGKLCPYVHGDNPGIEESCVFNKMDRYDAILELRKMYYKRHVERFSMDISLLVFWSRRDGDWFFGILPINIGRYGGYLLQICPDSFDFLWVSWGIFKLFRGKKT